jgi:hypothetical protein
MVASNDPVLSEKAGTILGRADGSVVPTLIGALASDDALPASAPWEPDGLEPFGFGGPRDFAAAALVAHEPDPRVLEAEGDLLVNGSVATRRAMARAIRLSGVVGEARSLLIETAARDPDPVVRETMLGGWPPEQLPCERQIALAFASAKDPSPDVRQWAALMMPSDRECPTVDEDGMRSVLRSLLHDDDACVARAAANRRTRFGMGPLDEDEWLAVMHVELCALEREPACSPSFRGASPIRLEAVPPDVVARLRALRCAPESDDLRRSVVDALSAENAITQARALEAITSREVRDVATVPVLERLARACSVSSARRAAVHALQAQSYEPAVAGDAALERLAQDAPPDARLEAAFGIQARNQELAARTVLRLMGEGLAASDWDAAAAMLQQMVTSRSRHELASYLPDGPPAVRQRAEAELARALACPP